MDTRNGAHRVQNGKHTHRHHRATGRGAETVSEREPLPCVPTSGEAGELRAELERKLNQDSGSLSAVTFEDGIGAHHFTFAGECGWEGLVGIRPGGGCMVTMFLPDTEKGRDVVSLLLHSARLLDMKHPDTPAADTA